MRRRQRLTLRFLAGAAFAASLFPGLAAPAAAPPTAPHPTTLIVGGGPTRDYNAVAIESNVRYVDSLLPAGSPRRILFADGRRDTPTVLYSGPDPVLSPAETAFRALFEPDRTGGADLYRPTNLKQVDGPSVLPAINREFSRLHALPDSSDPILLYFTGHGARAENGDLDNNVYNLWNDGEFSVRQLAHEIESLPRGRPVVVVMVECFSGAFANLQFGQADPATGALLDRPLCGFFATTRERVAAGCTSEVNEANYRDFTGYFFAALTGKDRMGKPVAATDFDNDGVIEMDEAWAYAVMNEPSIDVPVMTSDVFLRRFVPVEDDAIAALPFSQVYAAASPMQKAILDKLSADLKLTGEARLRTALAAVREDAAASNGADGERDTPVTPTLRTAQSALAKAKSALLARYPALRMHRHTGGSYRTARATAIAYLTTQHDFTQAIIDAENAVGDSDEATYEAELRGARVLRLMRTAKSVVLEQKLRAGGNADLIACFDKVRALEHQNPLTSAAARAVRPASAPLVAAVAEPSPQTPRP